MGTAPARHRVLLLLVTLVTTAGFANAQELSLSLTRSTGKGVAGEPLRFWINALNTSTQTVTWQAPGELDATLTSAQRTLETKARATQEFSSIDIPPGGFSRAEYALAIPDSWKGETSLEVGSVPGSALMFVATLPQVQGTEQPQKGLVYFLKGRRHAALAADYDPDDFFKQHISGHDPLYFIAGTETPNAKFQISFKYRLLNENGWLADKAVWLTGFHLAYSQTSLWDWNAPSAPFFDSSYRPEFLYSWERVIGGGTSNWFRLDLQGGVQHESNGRAEPQSRSLNIAYLRPRITFGNDTGPQLTLSPRAWVYVGDLSDNPDLEDYRGFADLRAVFGWKRGLQVSALGRIGQRLSQGSTTIDVTYPLMQPPYGSFSLYLHAQYFTGYGESLIGYRERSDAFRAGISLYR